MSKEKKGSEVLQDETTSQPAQAGEKVIESLFRLAPNQEAAKLLGLSSGSKSSRALCRAVMMDKGIKELEENSSAILETSVKGTLLSSKFHIIGSADLPSYGYVVEYEGRQYMAKGGKAFELTDESQEVDILLKCATIGGEWGVWAIIA